MKKISKSILILFLVLTALFSQQTVSADVLAFGRRNLDVLVQGIEGDYSVDLFIKNSDDVQLTPWDSDNLNSIVQEFYYQEYYPEVLNGYVDSEGYYSFTLTETVPHHQNLLESPSGTTLIHYGYLTPPKTFKIVIVTSDSVILSSPVITVNRVNAEVTFDLSGVSTGVSQMNIGTIHETTYLENVFNAGPDLPLWERIFPYAVVFLFELLLFYFLGYRKKTSFILVAFFNLLIYVLAYFFQRYLIGIEKAVTDFAISVLLIGLLVMIPKLFLYEGLIKEKPKSSAVSFSLYSTGLFMVSVPVVFAVLDLFV